MARRQVTASIAALLGAAGLAQAQTFNESFDTGVVPPAGWTQQNNSSPIGTSNYFDGVVSGVFTPQAGASHLATNFNNGAGTATISNWMVSPVVSLTNGQNLKFWTRTVDAPFFPDRLQVRMNKANTGTNVGALGNATDVGDFTDLLLDINPTYIAASYPAIWTQFTVTITGVTGTVSGRLAFRYFVENGGPNGANSDYIGIDEAVFPEGAPPPATGHCCKDGNCTTITEAACNTLGGTNWVSGSNCNDIGFSCPAPGSGACCLLSNTCQTMTSAACIAANGVYKGDATACGGCPTVYAYTGAALPVTDATTTGVCAAPATADIVVNDSFVITSADAAFRIAHTWQGDLTIKLTKVGGPTVTMVDRPGVPAGTFGFAADNYGASTADADLFRSYETAANIYDAPAIAVNDVKGFWKPENSLAPFVGLNAQGTWRLEVSDCAVGDLGTFESWKLSLGGSGAVACYADCDHVGGLTGNDFQCFLNAYVANLAYADCDGVGGLTGNDFQCFLNKYVAGCS